MYLLNDPDTWLCFGILFGSLLVLMMFRLSERYDYVSLFYRKKRRYEEEAHALTMSFHDFYGCNQDPYSMSSSYKAYDKNNFDRNLIINWDYCSSMPSWFFRQVMYEFSKLYRHELLDIHPFHATKETELYFYGHGAKEEWYQRHPELIRYGLDKPYKPYKIDHPFDIPPPQNRKKIRGLCQAPLEHKLSRFGTPLKYEFETFPAEYTFEIIDNRDVGRQGPKIKWDDLVSRMDPEIVKECHRLVAPCPPKYFLEAYLSMAKEDIVLQDDYFPPLLLPLSYPESPHHLKVGIYYNDIPDIAQL